MVRWSRTGDYRRDGARVLLPLSPFLDNKFSFNRRAVSSEVGDKRTGARRRFRRRGAARPVAFSRGSTWSVGGWLGGSGPPRSRSLYESLSSVTTIARDLFNRYGALTRGRTRRLRRSQRRARRRTAISGRTRPIARQGEKLGNVFKYLFPFLACQVRLCQTLRPCALLSFSSEKYRKFFFLLIQRADK